MQGDVHVGWLRGQDFLGSFKENLPYFFWIKSGLVDLNF
jgi:hypothetical protein